MTEMAGEGRRRFLKLAGLGALALSARKIVAGPADPGARRWAMVVDPSRCRWDEGCNGCITACHTAHNVPSMPDPKHEVKWVWKEKFPDVFADQEAPHVAESLASRPILTLCNHCDDPPCTRVCPTKATWRRDDGIVAMDPHRCIGCRYCVAACPYGSRSFNFADPKPHLAKTNPDYPPRTKGVVEKCSFCAERIDQGRQPVCVESCREKAILFGDLNDPRSAVRQALRTRYALRRRPGLGTHPAVYYLV